MGSDPLFVLVNMFGFKFKAMTALGFMFTFALILMLIKLWV